MLFRMQNGEFLDFAGASGGGGGDRLRGVDAGSTRGRRGVGAGSARGRRGVDAGSAPTLSGKIPPWGILKSKYSKQRSAKKI